MRESAQSVARPHGRQGIRALRRARFAAPPRRTGRPRPRLRRVIEAVVRSMRPRQWTKNLLVVAAPLAAGQLFDTPGLVADRSSRSSPSAPLSSAVYLVNDVVDVESDRAHPRKRLRPIAAGELSVRVGARGGGGARRRRRRGRHGGRTGTSACCWWRTPRSRSPTRCGSSTSRSSTWPWSSVGFLMRAVAGGLAAGLPLSGFFLMVAGFGSLFMVAGKRYSELHTLGSEAGTRRSLIRYTDTYLRFVWGIAATSTALSYCLWAFEQPTTGGPVAVDLDRAVRARAAAVRRRHRRRQGRRAGGHHPGRPRPPGDRRRLDPAA